jgi:hypothetical protein
MESAVPDEEEAIERYRQAYQEQRVLKGILQASPYRSSNAIPVLLPDDDYIRGRFKEFGVNFPASHASIDRVIAADLGGRRRKRKHEQEKVLRIIPKVFPDGKIPNRAQLSNHKLVQRINKALGDDQVSSDTILRAVGRKKQIGK